ncbi:UNVERIFIED_CONTAM: PHD finger-like domain-containing protein 5A [Gekko kuhli]
MAKHHPDLIFCRKQAGVAIGRLCEKCDGKCVICDSYVRPCTLVRICDECNYGSYQGRCVICGGPGVSDAYYCKECTIQEKDIVCFSVPNHIHSGHEETDDVIAMLRSTVDAVGVFGGFHTLYTPNLNCDVSFVVRRDGCPKIVNLGSSKTDLFYERKKYGFKKR